MKKLIALCLAGCMMMSLGGCGASSAETMSMNAVAPMEDTFYSTSQEMGGGYNYEDSYNEDMEMEAPIEEMKAEESGESGGTGEVGVYSERKLIKTVDLNVETKEFDLVMATLEEQVNALGGYIEHMDTYNGSTYYGHYNTRNASLTIRIPKEKLSSFLSTISEISNVVRRSENVEDVTLEYVDLESRKKALQTEHDRLLELLEMAETVEDIIYIEEHLSSVRYQLENMESQLRTYDNKVDYSTVYLAVDEVKELTPVEEETTGQRIVNGFVDSVWDICEGMLEFAIWFIVHIPYILVWGVVIVAGVVVVKIISKKRKRRKENQKSEQV